MIIPTDLELIHSCNISQSNLNMIFLNQTLVLLSVTGRDYFINSCRSTGLEFMGRF